MKRTEYTHGGSVWKSIALLLRGLLNLAAFAAVWTGLIYYGALWGKWTLVCGIFLAVICTVCNLILPIAHLPKNH